MKKMRWMSIGLIAALFFSSCNFNFNVGQKFQLAPPRIDKIPLRIGLTLSPEICNFKLDKTRQDEARHYFFGESICYGIKEMMGSLFTDVVVSNSLEIKPAGGSLKYIIVPSIAECDFLFPGNVFVDFRAVVAVKYTVYSEDGTVVWFDTYRGSGQQPMSKSHFWNMLVFPVGIYAMITNEKNASESCMRQAIEDQFRQATEGLKQSPWWKFLPRE